MMKTILGISGKDSAAAAIVTKLHYPEQWEQCQLFFNSTRMDYPCIVDWVYKVSSYLGKEITLIDGDLPGVISRKTTGSRPFLPSRKARYCTREAKIQPMERWIGTEKALLFSGLRYDERERVGYIASDRIQVRHPLIEKGIELRHVFALLSAIDLMPPDFFWQTLYDAVAALWSNEFPLYSMDNFITPVQRRILFAGRSRSNCFMCFNQRFYEWLWCAETYPDLYEQASEYEKDGYTWIQGESLQDLLKRKDQVVHNKARKVLAQVKAIAFNTPLEVEPDLYDSPSCGLLCGK